MVVMHALVDKFQLQRHGWLVRCSLCRSWDETLKSFYTVATKVFRIVRQIAYRLVAKYLTLWLQGSKCSKSLQDFRH
jgi:hypothetical protein